MMYFKLLNAVSSPCIVLLLPVASLTVFPSLTGSSYNDSFFFFFFKKAPMASCLRNLVITVLCTQYILLHLSTSSPWSLHFNLNITFSEMSSSKGFSWGISLSLYCYLLTVFLHKPLSQFLYYLLPYYIINCKLYNRQEFVYSIYCSISVA